MIVVDVDELVASIGVGERLPGSEYVQLRKLRTRRMGPYSHSKLGFAHSIKVLQRVALTCINNQHGPHLAVPEAYEAR